MVISKRCGPSIPSCMEGAIMTCPDFPGSTVAELTTTLGGQHPSRAAATFLVIVTGLSPTFRML
jgi:hypothetical protein